MLVNPKYIGGGIRVMQVWFERFIRNKSRGGDLDRDNHAEGMVQKKRFLIDKTLCSPLNLTQLRTSERQNFNLAPSSGQKFGQKIVDKIDFFLFLVIYLALDWSEMAGNVVKWSKMTPVDHECGFWENWEKISKNVTDFGVVTDLQIP